MQKTSSTKASPSPDRKNKATTSATVRYKTPIPDVVEEYLQIVENGPHRVCKYQTALAKLIRKTFAEETLTVDTKQLQSYMGLAKYLPYELFPWEKFFVALTLCTYRPDGLPRYKTGFGMMGRGAGKDGVIGFGSLCLVSPFNPVRAYDVDICANNEEQATRPLKDLVAVLEAPEHMAKLSRHFYHTKEVVRGRANGGEIKGRTNNPKNRDGMRSGMVVFNEVHAYENNDNIRVFVSGQGKVAQPRVWIFTSNGFVNDGPLDDYLARSNRILFENEPDNGFLPFICCLEKKEQVHDPENWFMANPSLQYMPHLYQEIEDEYRDWKENPAQNGDFLTKRMGLRSGFSELAVTDYENILKTKQPLPDLTGRPCVVGIDYSELDDWAAVNLHFRSGDMRYDINHFWICEDSPTLGRIKAPWRDWVDQGIGTLVHEPSIHPALIAEYIRQAGRKYKIKKLAADHFRWTAISDELLKTGFDAKDKSKVKLVRPSDIMQADTVIQHIFTNGWFAWGDNAALRWATNNTKRVPSSRKTGSDTGNFYYAKIEPKSRKTDPFMALVASMTIEPELGPGGSRKAPVIPTFVIR